MKLHKWEDVEALAKPEVIARARARTERSIAAIELGELRKARRLTQEELAEKLATRQPNVSKLENRRDMRISTLREVVEAMGGELRITAHFPDADYSLDCCLKARDAQDD